MKRYPLLLAHVAALAALVGLGTAQAACETRAKPALRLAQKNKADLRAAFEVTGLGRGVLTTLARASWTPDQWHALLAVYVDHGKSADANRPPVLGSYEVKDGVVRFAPRFPLVRGVSYRAVFDPARLPGQPRNASKLTARFLIPPAATRPTVLEHVYPSGKQLPENQLKFYLHFSAPMSQGDSYRHIKLLNSAGKPVELPFLELEHELWDPAGRRFTLLFDPGRIKRGLKPREELGPVLEAGKTYTLVIDRAWPDAEGKPLTEAYRKTFKALAPVNDPPAPKTWKLQPPAAAGVGPLVVTFPRPMDHALLQRSLTVTDARGKFVPGTVTITAAETRWEFRPRRPWAAGRYELSAETTLEDLAGNNLERPFEVDVFHPIQRRVKTRTVKLPFAVGSK